MVDDPSCLHYEAQATVANGVSRVCSGRSSSVAASQARRLSRGRPRRSPPGAVGVRTQAPAPSERPALAPRRTFRSLFCRTQRPYMKGLEPPANSGAVPNLEPHHISKTAANSISKFDRAGVWGDRAGPRMASRLGRDPGQAFRPRRPDRSGSVPSTRDSRAHARMAQTFSEKIRLARHPPDPRPQLNQRPTPCRGPRVTPVGTRRARSSNSRYRDRSAGFSRQARRFPTFFRF